MLGGGKECKEFGCGDEGVPTIGAVGGGRPEESGSTTGGEFAASGDASSKIDGEALPSMPGTLGKYPPPSDTVRSAVDGPNGDTSGGAALW